MFLGVARMVFPSLLLAVITTVRLADDGAPVVLEGVVRFAADGGPVEGASVWAVWRNYETGEKEAFEPVLTDALGGYRLSVATTQEWFNLYAGFEGHQTVAEYCHIQDRERNVLLDMHERVVEAFDFELAPVLAFRGTVQAALPISSVLIEARTVGYRSGGPQGTEMRGASWQGTVEVGPDGAYFAALTYSEADPATADLYPGVEGRPVQEITPVGDEAVFNVRFFTDGFDLVTVENLHLVRGEVIEGVSPDFATSAGSVSGTLVDASGAATPGVPLQLLAAREGGNGYRTSWPRLGTESDDDGGFRFDTVPGGAYSLGVRSRGYRLVSGSVGPFESQMGVTFTIMPATALGDVRVVVARRIHLSGHILNPDGTPLASSPITYRRARESLDGRGSGSGSGNRTTDADGTWEEWMDEPGVFTFTVRHGDLEATRTFRVEEQGAEVRGDLVLGEPTVAWVINPANGHSYALIDVGGRPESAARASVFDAHLVAINDAEEQSWLVQTFRADPLWIGLRRTEAGHWEWPSGEKATYTNWAENEPSTLEGDEDVAIMNWGRQDMASGSWKAVSTTGRAWHRYKAIIERAAE